MSSRGSDIEVAIAEKVLSSYALPPEGGGGSMERLA